MEILSEIEAAEDEILLEELDWSKVGNDPKEIQVALAVQSQTLNTEIIDFLLQWEEDENVNKSLPDSKRVRDTFEVLDALSQVDNELEGVDGWISDQIDRLAQIQSRLSVIEHESGTLESSYQNLTSIQEMVESLVVGLSISRDDEEILLHHPHEVIDAALKLRKLDHSNEIIQPLIAAVSNIKDALSMKGGKLTNGISSAQWKQLQAMAAVTKQKQKLLEMKDYFTKKFSRTLASLFENVLKHKSLHKEVKSEFTGIEIKQFSFAVVIDHGLKFSARLLNASEHDKGYGEGFHSAEPALSLRHSAQQNESNLGLQACMNYHRALAGFLPLYGLVLDLSPSYIPMVSQAYVSSTLERLYIPVFRIMFREIRSLVMPKSVAVTFANISKSRHSQGLDFEVPVKFLPRIFTKGDVEYPLTLWAAVGAVILAIAPILKKEETFFLALFNHLDINGTGYQNQQSEEGEPVPKGETEKLLDLLFSTLNSKLQKLCNLPVAEIDGMELLGILAVLQQYLTDHFKPKAPSLAVISNDEIDKDRERERDLSVKAEEPSTYLVVMLQELRVSLLAKLQIYIADQIAWILAQKSDPKKSGVLVPVAKFPSFVRQVLEMTGGQRIDFVDQLLHRVAKELFQWVSSVAALNDKYSDIVKVQNFGFFALSVGPLKQSSLEKFVGYAGQQKKESEGKYVLWMVSYAFPALSILAARMDGVGSRVREEELALYVRRKDVVSVVKELDSKSLSDPIGKMYKRLEKHFASSTEDQDLDLVSICWIKIRDRVTSILTRLEEAASASYQISLNVGPQAVKEMFNKFRKHK